MPTTARISIAAADADSYVQQNLDDVLNTSFSRQDTLDLGPAVPLVVNWPVDETFVYWRLPKGAAAYTVTIKEASGDLGWTVSVPAGIGFVPVLLPKPQLPTYSLTASVAVSIPAFYF